MSEAHSRQGTSADGSVDSAVILPSPASLPPLGGYDDFLQIDSCCLLRECAHLTCSWRGSRPALVGRGGGQGDGGGGGHVRLGLEAAVRIMASVLEDFALVTTSGW